MKRAARSSSRTRRPTSGSSTGIRRMSRRRGSLFCCIRSCLSTPRANLARSVSVDILGTSGSWTNRTRVNAYVSVAARSRALVRGGCAAHDFGLPIWLLRPPRLHQRSSQIANTSADATARAPHGQAAMGTDDGSFVPSATYHLTGDGDDNNNNN